MNEEQVRNITRKFLDEQHLLGFIKIFEKEHNLFRGSHDKLALPEDLAVPEKIIQQVIEGGNFFRTITGITNDVVANKSEDILTLETGNAILSILGTPATDNIKFTVNQGQIEHDELAGFVADEHIDHSAVSISAGGILSGGGTIDENRTISLDHGDVDHDQLANTHNLTTDIDHDALNNYDAAEHFTMLDEDDLVSNSATQAATQQSIKAYVDALPATFLGLTDTPINYAGSAGKVVVVNATPDALEFVDTLTLAGLTVTDYIYFDPTVEHVMTIGYQCGNALAAGGTYNYLIGEQVGYSLTTGDHNVYFGYQAGYYNEIGIENIVLGNQAMKGAVGTSPSYMVVIGYQAGYIHETGDCDVFIGSKAGYKDVNGYRNFYLGYHSGYYNPGGHNNVGIGYEALRGIDTYAFTYNVAIGSSAMAGARTANQNVAIGYMAGTSMLTCQYNVVIGSNAGDAITTGHYNVGIGCHAFSALAGGTENVGIGYQIGYYVNYGNYNTLIGHRAGFGNASFSQNTLIGHKAGYTNTGGSCVFIGYQAGYNEVAANKLYIANSNTATPLIYGEFDNGFITINGYLNITTMKSGATQGAAGAAANELWYTSGHATLPDNVVMMGV